MTQAVITKVKNNAVYLPKTWKDSRIFVRITDNTATITRLPSPKIKTIFTQTDIRAMRKLGTKISKSVLAKARSAS